MTWEQTIKEYAKDAFEEGKEEGVKETSRNNAINLLQETNLPLEVIAKCCVLSLEEVLALKESLQVKEVNA